MPVVNYVRDESTGFRRRSNPGAALGALERRVRLGIHGLGDANTFGGCVQALDANGNPVPCGDSNAVVWMDANGNAVPPGTATGVNAATLDTPSAVGPGAVPDGSVVVYQGTWTAPGSYVHFGATEVQKTLQAVIDALRSFGLQVRNQSVGNVSTAAALGVGSGVQFPVSLTIQVETGMGGFGNVNDVASIVNHAVYVATGQMPLTSAITSLQVPGGSPQTTGQPGLSTSSGLGPQTFTSWLESNAWWIALIGGAAFVLPKVL